MDVFLFGQSKSLDGESDYKSLGKAGVTIVSKGRVAQKSEGATSSVDSNHQKILVLYRSKQETLVTLPITGQTFIFNIQNDKYGCFYTTGGNQQKVHWRRN